MIAVDYLGPQNLFLASAAGATWTGIGVSPSTLTVTGSTNVTSTNGASLVSLPAPTFTSGTALTLTNGTTLTIQGAPVAAGSLTLTNPYSLWVQSGAAYFQGDVLTVGSALAQTNGFLYIPAGAGAPSGTPALVSGASTPLFFDVTDHRLYFYESSGWHYVTRDA